MPKLILLNGPPACGKSTLAERYAQEHTLTLNLDIDRIRELIGGWEADKAQAGILARSAAIAAARVHLETGHDVVVPQLLRRLEFLDQLEQLAIDTQAVFHEIVLLDEKANWLLRFAGRNPEKQGLTVAELAQMHDELVAMIQNRDRTVVISVQGGLDEPYQKLLKAIEPGVHG